jgi:ParB family chromosome partitioning protein
VGKAWQIFALLPLDRVHPTPYQRDLSQPHVKRLGEVIKKLGRFIDPLVVIRTEEGSYWTPNGNHRLAALKKLKAKFVPVVLIPDPNVAFQILALNTEKAHNLKDKSLEVIRMYRALMETTGRSSEQTFAFQFEEAYFITLGLVYEKKARFAGSVFAPILRRVDKFLKEPLTKAFEERQARAATLERVEKLLNDAVKTLKSQGITHPYVKNFVIARVNPLSRARKTLPSFSQTFDKLEASLEKFDPSKIRMTDVARAAG